MLGLTQPQLAQKIGVSYQQVNKYEQGINNISAGKLYEIALALNVSIDYFYEGLGQELQPETPYQRRLQVVVRSFAYITNDKHQEAVNHLARALACH
jgi:transcriptional regulator with XRE-family HTH domain